MSGIPAVGAISSYAGNILNAITREALPISARRHNELSHR